MRRDPGRKSKKGRMKISAVVADHTVSARAHDKMDPFHVGRLRDHYRGGAKFDPLVVNAEDHTLTDGFHRLEVYRLQHGPDHVVDVALVQYPDKIDQMLHAGEINTKHGKTLDSQDIAEFVVKMRNHGVGNDAIGTALCLTVEKIDRVCIRRTGVLSDGSLYAVKPAFRKYAAGRIPGRVQAANERMGGRNQEALLWQLITILQVNAVEEGNETVMRRLEALYRLIRKMYGRKLKW